MKQAQAFVNWAAQEKLNFVMPINSVALLSAIPRLPAGVQTIMRCANAFDHGYRITVLQQNRVARIVATTPRHVHDLTNLYGADSRKLVLIPHGIDPSSPARSVSPLHRNPSENRPRKSGHE